MDDKSKELCPRLIDFLVIVGRKPDSKLQKAPPIGAHVHPSDVPPLRRRTGFVGVANPEILRRYPTDNHKDFTLPTDVTYFCQPEGCITVADNYKHSRKGHETTSFIYMLTEKDTSKIRYGITLNFFVHFDAKPTHTTTSGNPTKRKPTASLTSLCLISHHPFLSTFAEILRLLAQLIDACNMRCNFDDSLPRDSLWMVLTGHWTGPIPQNVMQEVKQIETWILLLLSSPVPVPGKTKLVLEILPEEVMKMQEFALPDHTRFSMMDFPLHLPLELLNVDTVITLLTAVMLEHKVILQSRNYNAVSMCVMSLVALLYPLEYMFPVIPLLPTFLQNAEQLLLAPTPFIIGLPASFFLCKGIKLPDDVMLVDLDTNEVTIPPGLEISELPEPERSNLKQDFLAALGKTVSTAELNESHTNGSFEASYQMDPDEIDVACRIAMINFFDSPNVFANFSEHTRTLRLYPRPVVALQTESFLRSRPYLSQFIQDLCRTQSVEYFAEECLCPRNEVFVRVQNGNTSAKQIGDKLKWFSEQLMPVHFNAYPNNCTLVEALNAWHLARNAHGSDEEDDVSDLESCGMDESMLTMSPFSEHAPDFEATKPVSEVNDVYQAPNKLQLPTSMSRLSMDSSISSGRSSPASTNSEAGNDSEADFARLAENLAIKSNEKGDFDFDHVMDSKESTPVQNRKVPLGPSVLSSTSSTPTTKTPQFKMKQAFTDSGEKMFGPNLMNTLNGYAEKSHGMLGSFFSKTAPKAQALREKTMRPLAEAAANRIEHGQHLIQNKRQHVQQENKDKDPTQAAQLQMKNQQTVRDICDQVLNGQGVGVFQGAKLKRLLEDESLRELVCQKLNLGVSQRYTEDDFLQRVQLTRAQYKGYLKILQACLHGLDHSYNSPHSDGLASLFHVLEIAHTHFWAENETHTPGSGISSLMGTPTSSIHTVFSPAGPSHKSSLTSFLSRNTEPVPVTTTGPVPLQPGVSAPPNKPAQPEKDLFDFNETPPKSDNLIDLDNGVQPNGSNDNSSAMTQSTSAVSDSARSETSEPPKSPRRPSEPPSIPPRRPSDAAPSSPRPPPPIPQRPPSGAPPPLPRRPPPLPERPDSARTASASPRRSISTEPPPVPPPALPTLPEKKSEVAEEKKTEVVPNGHVGGQVPVASETPTITQESPVVAPSANGDIPKPASQKPQANGHVKAEIEKPKSLFVAKPSSPSSSSSSTLEPIRHFLYQDLISASNPLWANMVFWENAFFDMVAKERDIIGMDQEPSEMIDRYSSLNESERKRLELDEDRIIAVLLHNMTAYMVMCGSPSRVLQQKVRRMLGKAHIGLIYSKKINQLLDELPPQPCNLIQLKPLGSRLVQKQSFAVHLGDTAEAPVSFMEVCEDAVIIRACTGQITERWWYERLVNMTYSPRTKVLCIWRRQDDQVHMHKFHTKKCRQLYTCMKTAMERAAQRGKVTIAGRDLGGEFPVHDIETSEGGLLQVRIDGVRLLFADRQDFISLANIKKCNTFGGNMFVLEEFNKQKNELIQRRYISTMARHVAWALHRMFSVRLTLNETLAKALADEEAIDELSGRASPMDRIDAHSDRGYDGDKSVDNSPMISPKRAKASGEVLRERLNMERPTICIQSSIESNEGSATPTASPSFAAKKRKRHRKLSQISFEHTNYPHELRFVTRLTSESDSEESAADFPFFSRPRAPSQPVQTDTEEMNIPRLTSSISMDTALNVWPRKQEDDNEVIEMDDLTPRTEVLPEFG